MKNPLSSKLDMDYPLFTDFFTSEARRLFDAGLALALAEDGDDLTSSAVFQHETQLTADIVAKETAVVAGLPFIPLILDRCRTRAWRLKPLVREGDTVAPGCALVRIEGGARDLIKAERIILNYVTHLSGIATLTSHYVRELAGTGVRLLDTRKTLPGLRLPEKYAVLVGGGLNHRLNLSDMLMLKDNHIDAAGSITRAVALLRERYGAGCPPIEVECRNIFELRQSLASGVERVMLDNMNLAALGEALPLVPPQVEAEVSGGVTLKNIRSLALASPRRPDYISVGRITHSAPAVDFNMRINQDA